MRCRKQIRARSILFSSSTFASLPIHDPMRKSPRTDSAVNPINSNMVIDPSRQPDWAGPIEPEDCRIALGLLRSRVDTYDPNILFKFWSRKWRRQPPEGNEFELPFGVTHGESR